jgi:hypothetical protein
MDYGAAADSLLRVQAGFRSSGCHRQAKARKGAARAAVLPAATAEAVVPSSQAAMASNAKSRLQRPNQEPRSARRLTTARASQLYTSTRGLIT